MLAMPRMMVSMPAICGSASGALVKVVLSSVVMGDPRSSMLVAVVTLIYFKPL